MGFVSQTDPQNTVVSCEILISKQVIFVRDRWPEGHRADPGNRSRRTSCSRNAPQAEKSAAIRREHDLLTILSPDRVGTRILERELFGLATVRGQDKYVPTIATAAPPREGYAQTVG